jgi:hypothetical protein
MKINAHDQAKRGIGNRRGDEVREIYLIGIWVIHSRCAVKNKIAGG